MKEKRRSGKPESRMAKSETNPNEQVRIRSRKDSFNEVERYSPFGFLSGFGLRPSVFYLLTTLLSFAGGLSLAAALPADWKREQHFQVTAPGLIKISLPVDTLDAARQGFEDLRLYDDASNETSYLIERPVPAVKIIQSAQAFEVSLKPTETVITFDTGLSQPIDGITLETPASDFIKAVQIEGSADGKSWQLVAEGKPIFRQPGGVNQLHLTIAPATWAKLRLTADDQRSKPIPFTGARVHAATSEAVPVEPLPIVIGERHENPGETRLSLNLGAANLDLSALEVETPEPLFMRQVTMAIGQISENAIREQTLRRGTIYRVALEGRPTASSLRIEVGGQVTSRELLLLIENQDSPPLSITGVRGERRPVFLLFLARMAGTYHLLTGNPRCVAPRYDLAGLRGSLNAASLLPVAISPVADNPDYRAPEVLAGVQEGATTLDVTAWRFRKPLKLERSGAQQVELDLDILSHAQPGFEDLRILRSGKQVPYILDRTSISRSLNPVFTFSTDSKDPQLSRWTLKLPRPGLPLLRLSCRSQTPLFRRELTLFEELSDERGEKYRRRLGGASWSQTPERMSQEFILTFDAPPQTDALILETHNGDNPAIALEKFQLCYPATRVLFKSQTSDQLFLYYGNSEATSPHYDLGLVAGELLAAQKADALPGREEQLRKSGPRETISGGRGGLLFWAILGLVVVVLLVIISRLLPKPEERVNP